jgi:serine/threonine protein kinase
MSYCLNPHCPQPKNSSNEQFCITCGTKILLKDRYRAIRPLGAGGMGKTFLAIDEDTPSKRQCVIKQFSPGAETANNSGVFQKAKELFNREAATLDRLSHISSQIPALLAYLEQDQRLYLVQEFIDGQNLFQEQLQHGNYSEAQVRQLLNDLLPVLKLIHQQGVIHRDIKPENIMRRHDGSQLVLIDFGLSKELSGTLVMTSNGTRGGTLGYAPLEQMAYGEAFAASDLYAIGATCVQLLTGEYPHNLYNLREKRWRWREVLISQGVLISENLSQVLEKLLQENYQQRYQTVAEVLADLNAPPPAPVTSPTPSSSSTSTLSSAPLSSPQPANSPVVSHTEQPAAISTEKPVVSKRPLRLGIGVALIAGLFGFSLWSLGNSSTLTERSGQEEIALTPAPSEPAKTAQDYLNEGNAYQDQGEYQAALAVIERAIELEPTAKAYFERGLTHYYLDNLQAALDDYNKAIELDPAYADAYNNRGFTHYTLGNNQAALDDYNKAIELDPTDDALAYYNRGFTHYYLGNLQAALDDYSKAIELNPNNAVAYNDRGLVHYDLGDNLPALADYGKAIELDPTYAHAYYNRGLIHQATGYVQEARSDFQQAANLYQQQGNTQDYQGTLARLEELN